jgi:hypothetical protein
MNTKPEPECRQAHKDWEMCAADKGWWQDQCRAFCGKCTDSCTGPEEFISGSITMAASSDNPFIDATNPVVIAAMKEAVASLAGNGVEPERIVNLSMTFSPETAAANKRALRGFSAEKRALAANGGILTMTYAIEVPSSVSHRISEAMSSSTEAMAQQVISSKISEVGWIIANESANVTITLDVKNLSQPVVVGTQSSTIISSTTSTTEEALSSTTIYSTSTTTLVAGIPKAGSPLTEDEPISGGSTRKLMKIVHIPLAFVLLLPFSAQICVIPAA